MRRLELTEDEINACINLFDMAVKAGGLNIAQNALVLATKFRDAPVVPAEDAKD